MNHTNPKHLPSPLQLDEAVKASTILNRKKKKILNHSLVVNSNKLSMITVTKSPHDIPCLFRPFFLLIQVDSPLYLLRSPLAVQTSKNCIMFYYAIALNFTQACIHTYGQILYWHACIGGAQTNKDGIRKQLTLRKSNEYRQ